MWMTVFGLAPVTAQAGVIDRVHITPVYFPRNCLVSRMNLRIIGAGAGGTNLRIGIYADNGGTPEGGALLETSADIDATNAVVAVFTFATPRSFDRGISAWIALLTEDAVVDFLRANNSGLLTEEAGEVITGCRFQAAAFPALDDPCPAVTVDNAVRMNAMLRVDRWDE